MIDRSPRRVVPSAPTAALLVAMFVPLVAGCIDRTPNRVTIDFVHLRGQGGAWPYIIELGDSTAMYSEAVGSGWSGPVVLFASYERPERFRWHSSDTTVLTVDAQGVVTARGLGEADIHAVVDSVAGMAWGLQVIPVGVTSLRLVEVPERSVAPARAFAVTAHGIDGRPIPGVPFYGTLMLPNRAPSVRCADTPDRGSNFTPCDLSLDGSLVTEPVMLRVIVPTMVGRSESVEAELLLHPTPSGGSGASRRLMPRSP